GRLAVVGGGVVGVEMATAWQALGSSVTLLVRGDGLLPKMEPFAGEIVAAALKDAGVEIRTGTSVAEVRRAGGDGGAVALVLDGGERLEADQVLFATGRAPRTDDLGLETVGLEPGSWLAVDDSCRVTAVGDGWLYAVGDANHRALLTHQGKYQARIAGDVIAARARGEGRLDTRPWGAHVATADSEAVPQVVFTVPEIASVGLTAAEAERQGRRTRVVDYDMGQVAGASLFADGYRGRARLVVDEDRGHLVGATFVGPGVAELLQSATVAVVGEVPMARLCHAVPSYPTISEVWLWLLEAYRGGGGSPAH
ncbi:FAD-dependent oxidoreductase, partial [Streptomyces pathocidini]